MIAGHNHLMHLLSWNNCGDNKWSGMEQKYIEYSTPGIYRKIFWVKKKHRQKLIKKFGYKNALYLLHIEYLSRKAVERGIIYGIHD